MFNKIGVSPVVATALLLVVAVVSVVGFSGWFSEFSSSVFVDVEKDSSNSNSLRAEGIYGDNLYLKSDSNVELSLLKITNSFGDDICSFSNSSSFIGNTKLMLNFENLNITDLSGNNNNGTVYNDVDCSVVGVSGNGCSFDGVGDYIEFSNNDLVNFDDEFTISMYFKFTENINFTNGRMLFSKANLSKGIVFSMYNNSGYISTRTEIRGNGTHGRKTDFDFELDRWIHMSLVKTGINYKYYLNAEKIFEINESTLIENDLQNFDLGRVWWWGPGYFKGGIDEVVIYSKAISDDEVKVLYDLGNVKLYEQILSKGIKKLDVSNCNLGIGEKYNVLGFTSSGSKIDVDIIAK